MILIVDIDLFSLAFSVTLFCTTAAFAMLVMMLRRSKLIGGELGGPHGYKLATTFLFVALWLFYVIMSSFEAYGYIKGIQFLNIEHPLTDRLKHSSIFSIRLLLLFFSGF